MKEQNNKRYSFLHDIEQYGGMPFSRIAFSMGMFKQIESVKEVIEESFRVDCQVRDANDLKVTCGGKFYICSDQSNNIFLEFENILSDKSIFVIPDDVNLPTCYRGIKMSEFSFCDRIKKNQMYKVEEIIYRHPELADYFVTRKNTRPMEVILRESLTGACEYLAYLRDAYYDNICADYEFSQGNQGR